jgi:hypothetical protein
VLAPNVRQLGLLGHPLTAINVPHNKLDFPNAWFQFGKLIHHPSRELDQFRHGQTGGHVRDEILTDPGNEEGQVFKVREEPALTEWTVESVPKLFTKARTPTVSTAAIPGVPETGLVGLS